MKKNRSALTLCILITAAVIMRIIMQKALPVLTFADAADDDLLALRQAEGFMDGHWLGPYTSQTLEKLPGFSLVMAFFSKLGFSYFMWESVLYCGACLLFYFALRRVFSSRAVCFTGFLLLLFCPVMLDYNIAQRVYNPSLLPSIAVFAAAGCIGAFADRKMSTKRVLAWMLAPAFACGLHSVLRFDTAWLTAFCLGAAILTAAASWKCRKGLARAVFLVVLCLPLIAGAFGRTGLSLVNGKFYGVRTMSDFNYGSFADTCSTLLQIEDGQDDLPPEIYVSRKTFDLAYSVSPLFAELKEGVDSVYDDENFVGLKDGEFEREFYAWVIRSSAARQGHYVSAAEAEDYFRQVNLELNDALNSGKLQRKKGAVASPFIGLLTPESVVKTLGQSLGEDFVSLARWDYIEASAREIEPGDAADLYEKVTHELLIVSDAEIEYNERRETYVDGINRYIGVWRVIGPVLSVLAAAAWVIQAVFLAGAARRKENIGGKGWILAVEAGLFLGMWANLFILSTNFYMYGHGVYEHIRLYAGGAYVLWQMFIVMSLAGFTEMISAGKAADKRKHS